jgi:hypothetical protein
MIPQSPHGAPPAQRLSIGDAACALGLSRPTVKRRIKSGALPAVQERTPSGFKWFVLVDASTAPSGGTTSTAADSPDSHARAQVTRES